MSLHVIVRETSLLNLCSRFGYNTKINRSFTKVKRKYEQIKIIGDNAQNQTGRFNKSVRYKQSTDKQI
jgi:hypothetical protein